MGSFEHMPATQPRSDQIGPASKRASDQATLEHFNEEIGRLGCGIRHTFPATCTATGILSRKLMRRMHVLAYRARVFGNAPLDYFFDLRCTPTCTRLWYWLHELEFGVFGVEYYLQLTPQLLRRIQLKNTCGGNHAFRSNCIEGAQFQRLGPRILMHLRNKALTGGNSVLASTYQASPPLCEPIAAGKPASGETNQSRRIRAGDGRMTEVLGWC
ncbi:hypothetical protein P167DRAFT_548255 [Morchella conica CCBAS932]|uniref:Uncharacterized protein n=1 Tax=Morchella conica CCBAS932 TaxID=1392247 RepID=A0A3N4KF41_9PEZI|nr:hypothetical protein P167DRAFT_548255 [Morchella conica CCBAS932]